MGQLLHRLADHLAGLLGKLAQHGSHLAGHLHALLHQLVLLPALLGVIVGLLDLVFGTLGGHVGLGRRAAGLQTGRLDGGLRADMQVVTVLALALARQIRQQELRQRHAALLVRLGSANVYLRADLNGVLRHGGPPTQHVEIAHPQPDRLTPTQPGVGQQQHQGLVVASSGCQVGHLAVGQVHGPFAGLTGQVDPGTCPVRQDVGVAGGSRGDNLRPWDV